jgi:hypothetical protein
MRIRMLLTAALIVSLLTSALLAVQWRRAERRANDTARWTRFVMDSLGTTLQLPGPPVEPWGRDSVYWQWVATTARLQSRRWQLAVQHWARSRGTMLEEYELEELRRKGLADPAARLRDSLFAHRELIPYDAVLGGTMGFNEVALLSPGFAFAGFDDGHIAGYMLLEFEVEAPGRVYWKRRWSRLD